MKSMTGKIVQGYPLGLRQQLSLLDASHSESSELHSNDESEAASFPLAVKQALPSQPSRLGAMALWTMETMTGRNAGLLL